uniref:DNA binding protein n=1 Tax=Rhizophora mucronata TaxID=61149 RepID=A0A2P2KXB3_RHIMU
MRKMMKSEGILYVEHVGKTMRLMNSGFVATYVKNGSMESV